MKKTISILLIVAVGSMLGGCATMWDRDIAKENSETVRKHGTNQQVVAVKKADSIVKVFQNVTSKCTDNTFACGAVNGMAGAMASRDIASITTQDYKGPVNKTGVDVQDKLVDKVGAQIPIGIVAYMQAKKGTGDETEINSNGGDIEITKSLNKKDQTAIASGDISQSNTEKDNADNPDNSVTGEAAATPEDVTP